MSEKERTYSSETLANGSLKLHARQAPAAPAAPADPQNTELAALLPDLFGAQPAPAAGHRRDLVERLIDWLKQ